MRLTGLVALLLLSLAVCCCRVAIADDECEMGGDDFCRCSTGNLTLDLRQIGLSFPASAMDAEEKYKYTYTPCNPVVCGDSGQPASALCQVKIGKNMSVSVGRYEPFKWTIQNYSPLQFEIEYGGGDEAKNLTRRSLVMFLASSGATKFTYEREGESLIYVFDVVGSGVAPAKGGSVSNNIIGPIGFSLIFLALAGLVAYFVIGGIFMYTQRGARGTEVIPNYAFWRDLPFLVKDGFFFTISPCYKRTSEYQGL